MNLCIYIVLHLFDLGNTTGINGAGIPAPRPHPAYELGMAAPFVEVVFPSPKPCCQTVSRWAGTALPVGYDILSHLIFSLCREHHHPYLRNTTGINGAGIPAPRPHPAYELGMAAPFVEVVFPSPKPCCQTVSRWAGTALPVGYDILSHLIFSLCREHHHPYLRNTTGINGAGIPAPRPHPAYELGMAASFRMFT